ncbi:MAG: hypothetical protein ABJB40_10150 [Acidobacteriota bacterium]
MKFISNNLLRYIAAACVALAIGVTAASVFGQETERSKARAEKAEYKTKDRGFCNNNWSGDDKVSFNELREMTVASTGSLNVDGGQNGGIGVKGEDRSDVSIRACVQAWGKTEDEAKAAAANVKIGTGGTIKAEGPGDDNHWSVSYQILVPRSTNINLKALNGGISISGTDGSAEFETQNGGISVNNVSGTVKGRTMNGGVNAQLSGTSWKGSGLDLQTTNGGINLTLPENYAAQIETGTVNGGYSSNIPALAITTENIKGDEGHGRERSKRIVTNINGGGAPIRVITTNGGVRINTPDRD